MTSIKLLLQGVETREKKILYWVWDKCDLRGLTLGFATNGIIGREKVIRSEKATCA